MFLELKSGFGKLSHINRTYYASALKNFEQIFEAYLQKDSDISTSPLKFYLA